jgi:VIT1/CCC1 family predicted Fe2+/Mn2+ transporter
MEVEAPDAPTLARWRHHWQEEVDAAFLYGRLAEGEPVEERRRVYRRLAEVERMHVDAWRQLLVDQRVELAEPKPSLRARGLAWFGQRFGPGMLLGFLRREEGLEVRGYLSLSRDSLPGAPRQTALRLARESASHAETLTELAEAKGEPWHRASSGGFVRNVIYGFNDGLTANFGLVAGVIGAAVHSDVVLLSGIAGMLADALSMGSSGYLAAKSEQEIYAHEIAMEREEIRLMPEIEEQELAAIYEGKGLGAERARQMARDIMTSSPEDALDEKVRVELGIGEPHTTPLREGLITGSATAVGAFIPVAPFLLLEGPSAVWVSFAAAMLFHFAVGAMRSLFTGRGVLRSGVDMFAVGLGVAAIGYLVGDLVVRWL